MKEVYKVLYSTYEESTLLHPETEETAAAERELSELIQSLPTEIMFQIDMLAGKLARTYEKQGFLFGLTVSENVKAEGTAV